MNFDISFEKHNSIFTNIRIYCFECPSRFRLQLQGEGTYQKKLDVKTFLFSSSNRETQRCNGRKSRLSKLLSLVQKQLQKYKIRDFKNFFFKNHIFKKFKKFHKFNNFQKFNNQKHSKNQNN